VASGLFLKAKGADPLVVDEGPAEKLGESLEALGAAGVRTRAGLESYEQLGDPDVIIVSPGVRTDHPYLQRARAAGAHVIGEVELAYRFCAAPLVGVTGTNGKGTTITMLEQMLQAGGLRAEAGGNVGRPLVGMAEGDLQVLVAELSSFQLETIELFHPWASILLNITPDHMDRYADMDEYVTAKLRLFANQGGDDIIVLNVDDPTVAGLRGRVPVPPLTVSLHDEAADGFLQGADLMARPAGGPSTALASERRSGPGGEAVRVCQLEDIHLPGEHYATDALCAALVALRAGVDPEAIAAGVRRWRPAPHQLADVAKIGGVCFVDDSKATNPESAIADLQALSAPLIVIAGGRTKGHDMRGYAEALVELAEQVFLIGEGAEEIARDIAGRCPVTMSGRLEEAVPAAFAIASPGDTIVLAPACASFDQFDGQAQRGERFAELVRALQ
jgi:UDP-N-acetylmuramoylalanine--D-glutamate ligase